MKYVIRIILLIIIGVLSYKTFDTVYSDIKYTKEVEEKEAEVIERLQILRNGELMYRDANGKFAGDFDELLGFMENGMMKSTIQIGDKDDSTTVFSSREIEFSVKDSMFRDLDIPKLKFVPGSDTAQFIIASGVVKKNNVVVPVFEIKDPYPFSNERKKKNNPLKVGSIFEVNYNGNWK